MSFVIKYFLTWQDPQYSVIKFFVFADPIYCPIRTGAALAAVFLIASIPTTVLC